MTTGSKSMAHKTKTNLIILLWIVLTDSLGWGIAFSVFGALFVDSHTTFLPITVASHYRYLIYEFMLGIYSVFMFICAPLIGGIADRYGRKPALNLSMLGLTLGFLLSVLGCYNRSLSLLIIGRSISGMTAGSLSVAQAAVVDMSTATTKAFNLSLVMFANCLGFSLGPILGGFFVTHSWGPTGVSTFLVGALMSGLGYLAILFLFTDTYQPSKKSSNSLFEDFRYFKMAMTKLATKRYLWCFIFSMIAYCLMFSTIPVYLFRQFGSNNSFIGLVLSGLVALLSITMIFGGKYLLSVYDNSKIVRFAQSSQVILYLMLACCLTSLVLNCILLTVVAITVALMYLGLITVISNSTEDAWQGRIMGVIASLFSLAWGVGPFLAGLLSQYAKGAPFVCAAFLVILALFSLKPYRTGRVVNEV
jgi:DHA1 family tetracycline resistance protein-like MFS transporter